jgi:glycolate oxidase
MGDIVGLLSDVLGASQVLSGPRISDDYSHDECLTGAGQRPLAVVQVTNTDEVATVLAACHSERVPVTARGSGTGLSGAAVPAPGGIVIAFERMNRILEIDTANHAAVVQPGVTLAQLDAELAGHGLIFPVSPGESAASLGGNVATNAGGMRAVKYGATRHHVLGLEAVLATGEVIRTGGKFVKATSGYDLTQLIVGSEGTLALVTEATLKLSPRPDHAATIVVPFRTLREIAEAVPTIIDSAVEPVILEYIDMPTMAALADNSGLDLGVDAEVKATACAYLVVALEQRVDGRLEDDVQRLCGLLVELGGLDAYVLPASAGHDLISAREKAFWVTKAAGADDIVDVVVPRASIPAYMATVLGLAGETQSRVAGCGHAGDGNVHLSVFQADPVRRDELITGIIEAGLVLGGAVSGEHGIGLAKKKYFLQTEDPVKIDLQRRIKSAFDPRGILNPHTIFD